MPLTLARAGHAARIRALLRRQPVVAVLGARQVGKTTLAGQVAASWGRRVETYDLEDMRDAGRLADPMLALAGQHGLVVLDEIQLQPQLLPALRVLADRPTKPARFLILGSASPTLLRRASESLAGRVAYFDLPPLTCDEVGFSRAERLWLRGGFPLSYLAPSETESFRWRIDYLRSALDRDLPGLGLRIPPATLRRFWGMLAHYHGQIWNPHEFASSFGVTDNTVRGYLDILIGTFLVRALLPWSENVAKRQVKSPKVYLADSGMLHALLNLPSMRDLLGHPKCGPSWEGFAMAEVVARLGVRWDECFFWATYAGAELDLLVVRGKRRVGFEFKRSSSPRITPSMRSAMADLKLERLDVIHAGEGAFPLAPRVRAVPLATLGRHLDRWG